MQGQSNFRREQNAFLIAWQFLGLVCLSLRNTGQRACSFHAGFVEGGGSYESLSAHVHATVHSRARQRDEARRLSGITFDFYS